MEDTQMKTTTIFKYGPSTQAVNIRKVQYWDDLFISITKVSKKFSTKRNQRYPQKRDAS